MSNFNKNIWLECEISFLSETQYESEIYLQNEQGQIKFEGKLILYDSKLVLNNFQKNIGLVNLDMNLTYQIQNEQLLIHKNGEIEIITFKQKNNQQLIEWANILQNYILCRNYKEFYEYKQIIGKGNFSTVVLAEKKHDKQLYAVKQIIKNDIIQNANAIIDLNNEINILRMINHKNLLNIKEFYETEKYYHFVSEYHSGGSIDNILYNSTYKQTKQIIKQILEGLAYLHSLGIMHRDLKPDNIIFKQKDSLELSIVDFGLSQLINEKYNNQKCGTPGYVAPEVINFNSTTSLQLYGVKCDVFSCGIIFYKLLTSKKLFQGKTHQEVLESNKKCDFKQQLQDLSENTTQNAYNLLKSMLQIDPLQRISAAQALQSPYFTESDDAYETFKKAQQTKTQIPNHKQSGSKSPQVGSSTNNQVLRVKSQTVQIKSKSIDIQTSNPSLANTSINNIENKSYHNSLQQFDEDHNRQKQSTLIMMSFEEESKFVNVQRRKNLSIFNCK